MENQVRIKAIEKEIEEINQQIEVLREAKIRLYLERQRLTSNGEPDIKLDNSSLRDGDMICDGAITVVMMNQPCQDNHPHYYAQIGTTAEETAMNINAAVKRAGTRAVSVMPFATVSAS